MKKTLIALAIVSALIPLAASAVTLPPLTNFDSGKVLQSADLKAMLQSLIDFQSIIFIANGKVGIGTASPVTPLTVVGPSTVQAVLASTPTVTNGSSINIADPSAGDIVLGKSQNGAPRHDASVIFWTNGNADRISADGSSGERFYFTQWNMATSNPGSILAAFPGATSYLSGKVGIATMNPAGTLDVNGNLCIKGSCITAWPSGIGGGTTGYFNVKDYGAKGDNNTDDTAAIQATINAATAVGGGTVFLPGGTFIISSTLNIGSGIRLVGSGKGATAIHARTNIEMIRFNQSAGSSLESIYVYDNQSPAATKNLVTVTDLSLVTIRECSIHGGLFALANNGTDGLVENCFISGSGSNGGNVISHGANWYIRDKLDESSVPNHQLYAFYQGDAFNPAYGVMENHFLQSDFSGDYTYSVYINDTANQAVTVFEGSVFSNPIRIDGSRWTNISNGETGSTITHNGGGLTITGSYGFVPTVVSGTGTNRACAANISITC